MYLFNLILAQQRVQFGLPDGCGKCEGGHRFFMSNCNNFFFFFLQLFLLRKISLMGYSYHAIVIK